MQQVQTTILMPMIQKTSCHRENILLFAITGQTATEIIKSRSDKTKINLKLTTWEDTPHGKILQADVVISKNDLNEMNWIHLIHWLTVF